MSHSFFFGGGGGFIKAVRHLSPTSVLGEGRQQEGNTDEIHDPCDIHIQSRCLSTLSKRQVQQCMKVDWQLQQILKP